MSIYSLISVYSGRDAGEDGIFVHFDEHDVPVEYDYGYGNVELFGNGVYFISRRELYKDGILWNIDEDIPRKIINFPEKYLLEVEVIPFTCRIIPREGMTGKRSFETKFRFF